MAEPFYIGQTMGDESPELEVWADDSGRITDVRLVVFDDPGSFHSEPLPDRYRAMLDMSYLHATVKMAMSARRS
jgi:hypothetical protein